MRRALAQSDGGCVVVGKIIVRAHEEREIDLMVVESGESEACPIGVNGTEDVGDGLPQKCGRSLRSQASRWAGAVRAGEACQLILKPGLIGDRLLCGEFVGDDVKRLSKRLPRSLVNKHIRRRVEIDAIRQVASNASDVADFHKHVAGQLALHGEINAVAASNFEIGVYLEGEILSAKSRYDRRRHGRNCGDGKIAIYADPEAGRSDICGACCGVATGTGRGPI